MFSTTKKLAAIGLVALALGGCATRIGDLNVLTTKNVDMSRMQEYQRSGQRVTGEDMKVIILGIPTGQPNVEEAADRAIEKVPGGVALVDAVVTTHAWNAILVGEYGFTVEGEVLVDPALANR